jgi:CHAT domain-containing protein
VPFAALVDARGRFLVERSAIVYAPSITTYALVAEARGKLRQSRPSSLFAVGNPTLDASTSTTFTSFYRDATLNPLPDAEREVDALQGIYRHAVVLKGAEATEAKAKAAVGGASVVHFATHALFDDHNPMYSRLALARDGSAPEDGWLEAWEIMRLDVPADLVVLSACETARGEIGGGEGVVGMAWSFFIAGARSTLATQWKVASARSADLMIEFHRSLSARAPRSPMRKAAALRDAQLRLMRDERYWHPYYWAAFVILGDGS